MNVSSRGSELHMHVCVFSEQTNSWPIKLNSAAILRQGALYDRQVEEELQRYCTLCTCYYFTYFNTSMNCKPVKEAVMARIHFGGGALSYFFLKKMLNYACLCATEWSVWLRGHRSPHHSYSGRRRCARRTFRRSLPRLSAGAWRGASVMRRQLWPVLA